MKMMEIMNAPHREEIESIKHIKQISRRLKILQKVHAAK